MFSRWLKVFGWLHEPEVELAYTQERGAALIDRVGAVTEVTVKERGGQRVLATFRRDGNRANKQGEREYGWSSEHKHGRQCVVARKRSSR